MHVSCGSRTSAEFEMGFRASLCVIVANRDHGSPWSQPNYNLMLDWSLVAASYSRLLIRERVGSCDKLVPFMVSVTVVMDDLLRFQCRLLSLE